jgi:hypothetical protein
MTTTANCTCGTALPGRAINANIWVEVLGENRFNGHYERRDFCSMECAKAAPQYVAPKRPRQPRRQRQAFGDMGLVAIGTMGRR